MIIRLLMAMALLMAAAPVAAQTSACGGAAAPCDVAEGRYLIERPPGDAPLKGAVVFAHGHGGSAAGSLRNRGLVDAVLARGYAFVAVQGMPRHNGGGNAWAFQPGYPGPRDDPAYLMAVFDDLAVRQGIARARILMSGFSSGGFMTSYLACDHPDAAVAYAPVSGGFWRPAPEACAGPVRLFHTHGWSDTTVPLEGRFLGNSGRAQGDIFHGMEIWRAANGCDAMRADAFDTDGPFWRRTWTRCTPGSALEFAMFPGGHMVPPGWADMALDWFEGLDLPS